MPDVEEEKNAIDWQILKYAIILLSLSLAGSIFISTSSYFYAHELEQQQQAQQEQLQKLEERYKQVTRSREIVNTNYLEIFETLQNQEFIQRADEKYMGELDISTLQRTEAFKQLLTNLSKSLYISSIELQFSEPQLLINIPVQDLVEDLKFYKTSVTLTFDIYHEEDMLHLLEEIEKQPHVGIFNIEHCQIGQLHALNTNDVSQPYFKADCEISWYTVSVQYDN